MTSRRTRYPTGFKGKIRGDYTSGYFAGYVAHNFAAKLNAEGSRVGVIVSELSDGRLVTKSNDLGLAILQTLVAEFSGPRADLFISD